MSRNQSFVRKVAYIAAIALLLVPLSILSQPAVVGPKDRPELSSAGGKLAQLRASSGLAQAQLGEIDPASETMKLSTLGMRGVAVTILWGMANEYKRTEDWDKVELTVNQIIRLQPNFLKVWDFQAHNLSYNISTEFDDYRMRYFWVKKGIEFLIDGIHYNRNEPGLLSNIGWFVGQKFGRADESKQFRRMFRDTDREKDFHQLFRDNGVEVTDANAVGPDGKPDNWLVSRMWYDKASDAVNAGKPIRGTSPLLLYNRVPMSEINAADAMQRDGHFSQATQRHWEIAAQEHQSYGDRELPTYAGFNIRLNDKEGLETKVRELHAELDQTCAGLRQQLRNEKIAKLPANKQAALAKSLSDRTPEEQVLAELAEFDIPVLSAEMLARCPRDVRPEVRRIVDQLQQHEQTIFEIAKNRNIVAFEYWRTRVAAEREEEARQARKDIYDADRLKFKGEKFTEARELYERAWKAWANIFKRHPDLQNNAEARELIESIGRYRDLLGQLEEPFPTNFVLNDFLDLHTDGQKLRDQIRLLEGAQPATTDETKPPDAAAEGKPGEAKPLDTNPVNPASDKPAEPKLEKPPDEKPTEVKPAAAEPSPPAANPDDKTPAPAPAVKP